MIPNEKDIERSVRAWMEHAKGDLKTAKFLLNSSRYTWCAFVCQQALEKCLKAGYTKIHKKIPPYTHKLEFLCQLLELDIPADLMEIIITVDKYYIATRYPAYKESVNISSKPLAKKIYKDSEEIFKWLTQTLELKG